MLEIVEGAGAGHAVPLGRELLLGRDPAADLVLDDEQVSRRHARLRLDDGKAVLEDLGSANGTFVNDRQVHGPMPVTPGDEVLLGVTVLTLRAASQPTVPRALPPPLAVPERAPDYVAPVARQRGGAAAGVPQLDRLVDSKVKSRAALAPLAILAITALVVLIFLAAG